MVRLLSYRFTESSINELLTGGNYWSNYNHFIDELVKNRCDIAHGGLDIQSYKYADEVLTKVIEFIDNYRTDLENLAVTNAYCRNSDGQ